MSATMQNSYGTINFDESMLAKLAGLAAMDCYGLVGMASNKVSDGIVKLLNMENLERGVKVTTKGSSVAIKLSIIIEYGVSLATVANNVIDTVKYKVEYTTGLSVERVDVVVADIRVN